MPREQKTDILPGSDGSAPIDRPLREAEEIAQALASAAGAGNAETLSGALSRLNAWHAAEPAGQATLAEALRKPLELAAGEGRAESAELLLSFVSAKGGRWDPEASWAALMAAARGGHAECVRLLLPVADARRYGAGEWGGRTALMAAAESQSVECVELLLNVLSAKSAAAKDANGFDATVLAAKSGSAACLELLLAKTKPSSRAEGAANDVVRVNAQTQRGGEAEKKSDKNAEKRKPKSNSAAPSSESYALMWAAKGGHAGCVEKLLPFGDPALSNHGANALMLAAAAGSAECVRLLIPVSDATRLDDQGYSALARAAKKGDAECVRLLLPVSAPQAAEELASYGASTALMLAAQSGSAECVKALLPVSRVDRRQSDHEKGDTALMMAAEGGHLGCVAALLGHGADAEARDRDGHRARERALLNEAWETATLLRERSGRPIALVDHLEWGVLLSKESTEKADALLNWALAQPAKENERELGAYGARKLLGLVQRVPAHGWPRGVEKMSQMLREAGAAEELGVALGACLKKTVEHGFNEQARALAAAANPWARAAEGELSALEACALSGHEDLGAEMIQSFAARPEAIERGEEWRRALEITLDHTADSRNLAALAIVAKMAFLASDSGRKGEILSRLIGGGEWALADSLSDLVEPGGAAMAMARALREAMPKMAARLEGEILSAAASSREKMAQNGADHADRAPRALTARRV
jgi:ankyrin repeat protein